MREVVVISMEANETEMGMELAFSNKISKINGIITKEDAKKIKEKAVEITDIINEAVKREVQKIEQEEIFSDMDKKQKELYDALPESEKRKVDEYERELKKLNTLDEKIKFTLETMLKELSR